MSEENKEITETEEVNSAVSSSKKKKIIIGVVIAVIICAAVAVICAMRFGGDGEEYTDVPVSTETTTELTPGIDNGEFVESAPATTQSSGSTSGGSGSDSQGGSDSQSGSGSQSGSQGSGSSGNSGSGNAGGSENEEPASRYIDVWITMPNDGGASDKLFVYVNGELQNEDGVDVSIDGRTYHFRTAQQYEGVVRVEARLQNYGTRASQISSQTGNSIIFALPLDGSEENFVDVD